MIGSIVAYKSDPAELEQAIRSFVNTALRVRMLVVDNSPTETFGRHVPPTGNGLSVYGEELWFWRWT